jgi:hypothetical protein
MVGSPQKRSKSLGRRQRGRAGARGGVPAAAGFGARGQGRGFPVSPRRAAAAIGQAEESHQLLQLRAWLPISSAVAASSSEAEAFCCVAWFSCPIAPLIWPTPGLLLRGGSDFLDQVGGLPDRRHHFAEQLAGAFGESPSPATVADFLRGDLRALGELAHFGGDDGEALAVLAGARRFDRGVQASRLVW